MERKKILSARFALFFPPEYPQGVAIAPPFATQFGCASARLVISPSLVIFALFGYCGTGDHAVSLRIWLFFSGLAKTPSYCIYLLGLAFAPSRGPLKIPLSFFAFGLASIAPLTCLAEIFSRP